MPAAKARPKSGKKHKVVDADFVARVRAEAPARPLTRDYSQIPHSRIRDLFEIVEGAGIAAQIDEWYWEDNPQQYRGGRPRAVTTVALLTLWMLLATNDNALLMTEMAHVVAHRLSNMSLRLLGLYGQTRTRERWEHVLRHAKDRAFDTVDSLPGNRWKFLTVAQIKALKEQNDAAMPSEKRRRTEWVANQLLEATVRQMGPTALSEWHGDITVDATPVVTYGKKGAPYSSKAWDDESRRGASDWSAAFYMRSSKHETLSEKEASRANPAKTKFGYESTLVVMSPDDHDGLAPHPLLAIAMGFDPAGNADSRLIHSAFRAVNSIPERGHPVGMFSGDRGYQAGSNEKLLTIPLRRAGYELITDYRDDQLGEKGGYAGAIQVEGAFYCPAMPKELINATRDVRAKGITNGLYDKRIKEREQYAFREKQAVGGNGSHVMMCPARGPGATAACPLVPESMASTDDTRTLIEHPPVPDETTKCCTNKHSVSFPEKAGAKYLQTLPFGSPSWKAKYSHTRSTIEGRNGYLKNVAHPAIENSGWRRLRGYTAQYLIHAFLVAASNLKLIDRWREEILGHESDDARQLYFDRKQQAKDRRKRVAADRAESWDNFALKNADNDNPAKPRRSKKSR